MPDCGHSDNPHLDHELLWYRGLGLLGVNGTKYQSTGFLCPVCENVFLKAAILQDHMQVEHEEPEQITLASEGGI